MSTVNVQICINQRDAAEKSVQVALMGDVYRKCSRALIWLGCDVSECNLHCQDEDERNIAQERCDPFALIRLFEQHIYEWQCFVLHHEQEDTLVFENNTTFDGLWKRHLKVSKSPWWTRMWTVQETLLPPVALFMYDTWSMPLQELLDFGESFATHSAECCAEALLRLPEQMMTVLSTQGMELHQLKVNSKTLAKFTHSSLDICQAHYGHRQCLDPRDKIYGVLGLIGHWSGKIVPDYSASLQRILYRATRELLDEPQGGLQSLRGFQYGPAANKWASWVRDFDRQWTQYDYQMMSVKFAIDHMFNAGGSASLDHEKWFSWPCLPESLPNQVALAATGRCIGSIKTISQVICPSGGSIAIESSVFKAWMEVADFDFEAHAAGVRTQKNEQIWRTMVGGTTVADNGALRLHSGDVALLDALVSWLECGQVPCELNLRFLRTISTATIWRTYFRTNDRGHGLCYPTCQPGDQVWVLHGATVPFVLRPVYVDTSIEENVLRPIGAYHRDKDGYVTGVKKGFEPRTGHYQLIGDCYYDGFMDGEALDDQKYPPEPILLV